MRRKTHRLFRKVKDEKGQAMVEMALVLPILLLLLCGILDFGWLFYNQLSLNNAAREGARYAVVNTENADRDNLIHAHIISETTHVFTDDVDITVTYSNATNPLIGDVTVRLSTDMRILTPVLGIFNGSQTKTIISSVTMRVES